MTPAPDLRDMLTRAARILAADLEGVGSNHWWWADRRRLLADCKAMLAAPGAIAAAEGAAVLDAAIGYPEMLAFARAYHGAVVPERELARMAAHALAVVDGRPAPASSGGTAAESLAIQARARRGGGALPIRSEKRRVGKECTGSCRSRRSPHH